MKTIAKRSGDVYIPRGVSVPALDKDILWEFQPKKLGDSWNLSLISSRGSCYDLRLTNVYTLLTSSSGFNLLVSGEGDLLTGGDLYAVSSSVFVFVSLSYCFDKWVLSIMSSCKAIFLLLDLLLPLCDIFLCFMFSDRLSLRIV